MNILVRVDVKAPMPLMHPDAARQFNLLRTLVIAEAGFDFLAVCGDICRSANFVSNKDGVANRSWHKTGRAFDFNQDDSRYVVVSDPKNGKQYFRTYLKCAKQDGSKGEAIRHYDWRGNKFSGYFFDFTAAAEALGFKRIPAWNGWQTKYIRAEFWHYQYDQNLPWAEAMAQLAGKTISSGNGATTIDGDNRVLGLNDRGEAVRAVQTELARLCLLPNSEVDGVFGANTKAAVVAFQRKNNLDADGLVGKQTRALLAAQK